MRLMSHSLLVSLVVLLSTRETDAEERAGRPSPDPKRNAAQLEHWGIVTEITRDTITIQFEKDPPRSFQLSETLKAGKVPKDPRLMLGPLGPQGYHVSYFMMYRIADVKLGDFISIHFAFIDGVRICDHICIRKRPGDRVPPLPDEAEGAFIREARPNRPPYLRYDEKINAYWDLEDHGIAYPLKFGERRRFPQAPLPREVKPK